MRRSRTAFTSASASAIVGAVLSLTLTVPVASAQQLFQGPAPRPPASTNSKSTNFDPMASARNPGTMLRNGIDFVKYKDYTRALRFLREAERRQNELDPAERKALAMSIAHATKMLEEGSVRPSPATLANNARRDTATVQAGAMALAGDDSVANTNPVQLTSAEDSKFQLDRPETAPKPAEVTERSTSIEVELPRAGAPASSRAAAPAQTPPTISLEPSREMPVLAPTPAASQVELPPTTRPVAPVDSVETIKPVPLPEPARNFPATAPKPSDLQPPAEPEARPVISLEPLPDSGPAQTPSLTNPPTAPAPLPEPGQAPAQAVAPPTLPEPSPVPLPVPSPTPVRESDPPALPPVAETPAAPIEPVALPPATPAPVPAAPPAIEPLGQAPAPAPAPLPQPDERPIAVAPINAPAPGTAPMPSSPEATPPPAPAVEPPPAPEAESLPVANPVPTPATANPEPAAPAEAPAASPATPGFDPNSQGAAGVPIPPEVQEEVARIARRQTSDGRATDAARPGMPADEVSSLMVDTQTRFEVSRPPSSTEARPLRRIPVPEEFVPLTKREWQPIRKYWAAAATCHMPLYFQDANLERYGNSVETYFGTGGRFLTYPIDDPKQSKQRNQILQPFFSAGLFAFQVVALPYNFVVDPPWEAEYDLGYYRPGDRMPRGTYYLPTTGVGPPLQGRKY